MANTQKWEYKVVTKKTKGLLKKDEVKEGIAGTLNQLGSEGWELVNVSPFSVTQGIDLGGSTKAYTLFFKRQK